ncbi:type II toxin-antitoxin system RelE family toxin [Bathymodiolus septemdierum thioautotrophic gill symbiont]|uniref:Addiction module toxin, RelE/StbE family n=1 Tax=endosymbiont of Bathymodiolus septemdierum str. Myojin knoll TaxID=1303921 RepID=A0A0P0UT51_9GAMM|nr:type II toxin-antitoxin system RelE/ParE family toxin [Bathymodiolus septemdierum thioautotrophic gill symbiont]BAS68400.1 addiction module toxin, RelE/StbE family [endosymbiont of Bathymodiolus septemdierum str. Myojin knoll]
MRYKLEFNEQALKEWGKLNSTIKEQFKKKLKQILENPKIPKNRLRGYENIYKIKLRQSGFRLAYKVIDNRLVVYVVAVGKRDKNKIYNLLRQRSTKDFGSR